MGDAVFGQHTLLEGDCLQRLSEVKDGSVDMVFADLPYGVTANKWDTPIGLSALWAHLLRVGKRNAAYVFTATQPFATTLINSQPKLFRYDLVWEKGNKCGGFLNANKMPLRAHEMILVFYAQLPRYNPQKTPGGRVFFNPAGKNKSGGNYGCRKNLPSANASGMLFPRSVQRFPCANNRTILHPTQKPVALLEWLIRTYSNPGDTILDPTAGSGTTLIAAENTCRRCIAIERDPTYCDTIRKRWAERPAQATLALAPITVGAPAHG